MSFLLECKNRSSRVIGFIRSISNLENLFSNEVIAQLNEVAFKDIKKGGLQKLIDKRALQNEANYQKFDKEAIDISNRISWSAFDGDDDRAKEVRGIIEAIGECPLTEKNTMQLLKDTDCMCLALKIQRPEAAIADASRVVIQDIYPTYLSADGFLQSSQFNLTTDAYLSDQLDLYGFPMRNHVEIEVNTTGGKKKVMTLDEIKKKGNIA